MASFEIREEVLNVVLADLLSDRGLLSVPESIRRSVTGRRRRLPDVTVADLQGVRIVIEGRIGNGSGIREALLRLARTRVEEGIAPICLAVVYPRELRRVDSLRRLRRMLATASLTVRVVSESDDGDWAESTLDGITEILRRSYELLVSEDVVVRAVEDLEAAIDAASETIASARAVPGRVRTLLGIPEDTDSSNDEEEN